MPGPLLCPHNAFPPNQDLARTALQEQQLQKWSSQKRTCFSYESLKRTLPIWMKMALNCQPALFSGSLERVYVPQQQPMQGSDGRKMPPQGPASRALQPQEAAGQGLCGRPWLGHRSRRSCLSLPKHVLRQTHETEGPPNTSVQDERLTSNACGEKTAETGLLQKVSCKSCPHRFPRIRDLQKLHANRVRCDVPMHADSTLASRTGPDKQP